MPDNGFQVAMFTHQDVTVWADLAEILWAAGLHVTAGWCIATETESATRTGNYVQGTVLLVLRRQSPTLMTLHRFSSRLERHGQFLDARLRGAVAYDRIAGYFRSSVFEIAGEAFEQANGPMVQAGQS